MADERTKKIIEIDVKASADAVKVMREMQKSMRELEDHAKRAQDQMREFGQGVKAALAGITFDRLAGAFKATVDAMDAVVDRSEQLGMSVTSVQEWEHAITMSGGKAEDLDAAVRGLSKSMAEAQDPGSKMAKTLADMGVAATGNVDQALTKIAEAFAAMPDGMQKTALAMDLFGKSGTKLIPLLNTGAAGIEELKKQAHELGIVFSDEAAKAAAALNDQLDIIGKQFFAMRAQIVEGMVPALQALTGAFSDAAKGTTGLQEIGQTLGSGLVWLTKIGIGAATTFELIAKSLAALFAAIDLARAGEFRKAGIALEEGLQDIARTAEAAGARIQALNDAQTEFIKKAEEARQQAQRNAKEAAAAGLTDLRAGFQGSMAIGANYAAGLPAPKKTAGASAAKKLDPEVRALADAMKILDEANSAADDTLRDMRMSLDATRQAMLDLEDPTRVIKRRIEEVDATIAGTFDEKERDALLRYRNMLVDDLGQAFNKTKDRVEETKDSVQELTDLLKGGLLDFSRDAASGIVDAFSGAKFEIDQIVRSILASIAKVMLQRAIMRGIDAYMNPYKPNTTAPIYPSGTPFARGGVVTAPTMFAHGGGFGIMGEAGPEAIVPLRRSSSGDLGVQASPVNVVINNNNGSAVRAEETRSVNGERQLQIMIDRAVEEGLGGGRFDRVLSTSYGVSRKGR